MEELIAEHAGVEVSLATPIDELRSICERFGVEIKPHYGAGKLILELYEKTCEAELWGPVFVTDYPVEVSPLSREHRERPGYTERFEAIVAGRELCNGFSELTDPVIQRERFEAQEADRDAGDDEAMVLMRTICGPWSTGCPHRRAWYWCRPAHHVAHGHHHDSRRGPVPDAETGTGSQRERNRRRRTA